MKTIMKKMLVLSKGNAMQITNGLILIITALVLVFHASAVEDYENELMKYNNQIEILKSKVNQQENLIEKQENMIKFYDSQRRVLNETNVKFWLDKHDVKNSDIVLAQIKLETGNFTSKICLENNNLAGMKLAKVRKTTAKKEKNGHAFYESWIDSIQDLKLFQEYYNVDDSCYFSFLERIGYAEDSDYIKKVKYICNKV
jgi:hypothetical protein